MSIQVEITPTQIKEALIDVLKWFRGGVAIANHPEDKLLLESLDVVIAALESEHFEAIDQYH